MMVKTQKYQRLCVLSLEAVLPLLRKTTDKEIIEGVRLKTSSLRLRTFAQKGTDCCACGLKASFFAIERDMTHARLFPDSTQGYHLNLYGLDLDGHEVLMTQDHIYPKSLGGSNTLDNSQTLCRPCNALKADQVLLYDSPEIS